MSFYGMIAIVLIPAFIALILIIIGNSMPNEEKDKETRKNLVQTGAGIFIAYGVLILLFIFIIIGLYIYSRISHIKFPNLLTMIQNKMIKSSVTQVNMGLPPVSPPVSPLVQSV